MAANKHEINASLLESGLYSDMTIKCEGRTFKVHKAIVCPQSPVLTAQMQGPWKEAEENVVNVTVFGATTVQRMLSYLYIGRLFHKDSRQGCDADIPEVWAPSNREALMLARLAAIADYYQVQALKTLASDHFSAFSHGGNWFVESFLEVMRFAWDAMPQGDKTLKTSIETVLEFFIPKLCGDYESVSALGQGDGFTTEIVWRLAQAYQAQVQLNETTRANHAEALLKVSELLGKVKALKARQPSHTSSISMKLSSELCLSSDEGQKLQKLLRLYVRCSYGCDKDKALLKFDKRWVVQCQHCSTSHWVDGTTDRTLKCSNSA